MISVIIPMYNSDAYVKRCIESIIDQSYSEFEIICVDNGSKDKTIEILEDFKDCRIKIIRNSKNLGVSNARNIGIESASGEYIAFVDSDDYLDKNYIRDLYEMKADLSIINYKEEYNNKILDVKCFDNMKIGINKVSDKDIENIICSNGGYVWGKLFKKSIMDKYNITFNKQYNMCEDLLFTLEFVTKSKNIYKSNKYSYVYFRSNENSITKNLKDNELINQINIQSEIKNIIQNKFNYKLVNEMLSKRFKNIFMFMIYKISINKTIIRKEKINQIENLFNYKYVLEMVKEFDGVGPIDKILVKSIKTKRIKQIYLYTLIREAIIKFR